jgi:hypothetical protein
MPKATIVVGVLLSAIGLWGFFGSASDHRSVTALIPAFVGVPLLVLGALAVAKPDLRKHTMHAAAALGLLGFVMAGGRAAMTIARSGVGVLLSDDPTIGRAPRMVVLMALVCLVFTILCVASFVQARRRRTQEAA